MADYELTGGLEPNLAKYESGLRGWEDHFFRRLPDVAISSTTGGASVTSGEEGTIISAGTTTDDEATVSGSRQFGRGSNSVIIREIVFESDSTTPLTDSASVGATRFGAQSDAGAYLDLTAAEYNVGGTTQPATLPNQFETTKLRISVDLPAGETVFEQTGPVEESVTINATPSTANRPDIVALQSNGGGDDVVLKWAREVIR